MIRIPPELLGRYSAPSPRYTSYPTVTHWESAPTGAEWIADLDAALAADPTRPGCALYVHIPFCQSLCTFCGCHMRVVRNHSLARPYVDVVLREFGLYLDRLGRPRLPLGELHLGGGTPTFLPAGELDRLLDGLLGHTDLLPGANLAVESDPRSVSRAQLATLRRHSCNRISFGVQDMDPRVQDIVNRPLDFTQLQQAVGDARELGFESIAFDLIYGLPLQTPDSMRLTMDAIDRLLPDRIAFYPYAHVPWIKPSQRRYTEADLPEGEDKRQLYLTGRERLDAAGYIEIGLDQFALSGDALALAARHGTLHRNFMGYTAAATCALIGLGVSAIGDAVTSLAQNEKSQQRYEIRVQAGELPLQRGHALTPLDLRLRRHVFSILTRYQTQWAADESSAAWRAPIEARLQPLQHDGLIACSGDAIVVTELGRAFLRSICAAFDVRLHAAAGGLAA